MGLKYSYWMTIILLSTTLVGKTRHQLYKRKQNLVLLTIKDKF